MAAVLRILVLATIFACILLSSDASIALRVPPNFGCLNGRKDGLFRHRDISACKGSWLGHIQDSSICSAGWHVCAWNDTETLSSITWYQASHIDGCYAINAAHNNGNCQQCTSEQDELAGIGADCPRHYENIQSCFGNGKIDASCCSRIHGHEACGHKPWISGVICCKDKRSGTEPTITVSPISSARVPIGHEVLLKCKATGSPSPSIAWYKNGYPVAMEGLHDEVTMQNDVVYSRLRIPQATSHNEGLYLCRAENRHGFAVSYTSDVTIYEPMPRLVACKNTAKQELLHGGAIAACKGRWKGTVKRSSKQLCAKGWHVCGLKDRHILHKLSWTETMSLPGCYAYDAATSHHFACTRCTHRNKGNSMSGVGAECGMVDRGRTSCLNKGRIDVRSHYSNSTDEFDVGPTSIRGSCGYMRGVTTGVMCCPKRKHRKGRKLNADVINNDIIACNPECANGGTCMAGNICKCPPGVSGGRCEVISVEKKCSNPCAENSHCTRKGVCKCDRGFKSVGDVCISRSKGKSRRCSKVVCQNGGRCKRGECVCTAAYSGLNCERVIQSEIDIN